jgi:hypothetical protein
MSRHVTAEGAPLRADGTPFPADPAEWSPEEAEHLEQYWFDGELTTTFEVVDVMVVDAAPA